MSQNRKIEKNSKGKLNTKIKFIYHNLTINNKIIHI